MSSIRSKSLIRAVGFAVGLAIAVVAISLLRVPAGAADKGLELRIGGMPSGELAVDPPGNALRAADLQPGERARGRLTITNLTGLEGLVRIRASFDEQLAARSVRISISDRGTNLYKGSLAGLDGPVRVDRPFEPGESRRILLEATIDPVAERGWRGAIIDVQLDLSIATGRR